MKILIILHSPKQHDTNYVNTLHHCMSRLVSHNREHLNNPLPCLDKGFEVFFVLTSEDLQFIPVQKDEDVLVIAHCASYYTAEGMFWEGNAIMAAVINSGILQDCGELITKAGGKLWSNVFFFNK